MVSHDHALGECRPNDVAVDDTSVKVVFFIESKVDTLPHLRMVLDPLDQRLHGSFPNSDIPVGTIFELHLEDPTLELASGVLGIGVHDGNTFLMKIEQEVVFAEMELLPEKTTRFVLVRIPNGIGTKRRLRVVELVQKIQVDQILDGLSVVLRNADVNSVLVLVLRLLSVRIDVVHEFQLVFGRLVALLSVGVLLVLLRGRIGLQLLAGKLVNASINVGFFFIVAAVNQIAT